jgi:hypothetical protein
MGGRNTDMFNNQEDNFHADETFMIEFNPDDLVVNMSRLNQTDCSLFAETADELTKRKQ